MLNFFTRFFDSNEKELNKLRPLVSEINSQEAQVKKLKDSDFPKKTAEFKERIANGESLDLILPEAFANAREASVRAIGFRHFDVQLMAAITLYSGKIAEQKTGEGKTLSAVPALYLHALSGKNVHLVTVNDYLARRDCGWMGPIFNFLGLSVSSIINQDSFIFDPNFENKTASDFRLARLKPVTRKEAYEADIVYGINSEFGFDYLRDNMVSDLSQIVQRGNYFAIVDEVDSVLIDEARTPHIISAPDEAPTQKYYEYAKIVSQLSGDTDYKIDEKFRTAHLTDHGISKIEKLFGISDIYEKDFDTVYHLEAALKARTLFHKEKDYIVKDNEVILVDEFTGRLMVGRRLSEGLHQAIEAKEGVSIQRESKTLATVSLQNYFRMYEKLAGMTGTAVTEAEEFHKIYKVDVISVPTHRPMIRKDNPDTIYKTGRAKLTSIANAIEEAIKKGQPVLVGTTSIDKNEIISELLKRRGIKHEVLNAKNHEREAEIIAKAGERGSVTVATNMAGRGVDIILGGDTPKHEDGRDAKGTKEWETWEKKHKEVVDAGGLLVLGTERHESRRIDNQLRGRSGRQGDPGESLFVVALDDDLMRIFGGEQISNLMTKFNIPEETPLAHPIVSRAIAQAQGKVETYNFDIRKHLVEYDDVLNRQREIIYQKRREILEAAKNPEVLRNDIHGKIENVISNLVGAYNLDLTKLVEEFSTIIPFDEESKKQIEKQLNQLPGIPDKTKFLTDLANDLYKKRQEEFGEEITTQIERFISLQVLDNLWTDHLDAIDNLRSGIGLRGYAQKDPLVEYKNEAFRMFERLITTIDDQIVHMIYKIQVQHPTASSGQEHPQGPHVHTHTHTQENTPPEEVSQSSTPSTGSGQAKKKLGRNDPCWCGSGKKWKKCHYPQLG